MSAPCSEIQPRILAALLDEDSFGESSIEPAPRLAAGLGSHDEALGRHLTACPACRVFADRQLALARALGELPPRTAPPALEEATERALRPEGRSDRALAAVVGLERLEVPAALDEAIARRLDGTPVAPRWIRTLERFSAPAVLDRLVEEELADPAGARVRRFAGSLERVPAPRSLGARTQRALTGELLRPSRLRFSLAAAGLAAAALLVWALPRPGAPQVREAYGLRVTYVSSSSELDPLARELLDGLSGGVATAIQR